MYAVVRFIRKIYWRFFVSKVCDISWNITGFTGCCKGLIINSLRASMPSDMYDRREKEGKSAAKKAQEWIVGGFNAKNQQDFSWNQVFDLTQLSRVHRNIPLELAYTAVLFQMNQNEFEAQPTTERRSAPRVWMAIDNVAEQGHWIAGPFSVRHFIEWLIDNELALVEEGSQIGNNKAWSFELLNIPTRAMIKRGLNQLRELQKGEAA